MPTFGLVVEGAYDARVLQKLIAKCKGQACEFEVRKWAEEGGLSRKFYISLEEFELKGGIDKAFVVRDADGGNANQIMTRMRAKIAHRRYSFPVKFAVAVQEIEAWLMADENALSQVAGSPVPKQPDPIESIIAPKERLFHLLLLAGVVYTADIAEKIASASSIGVISTRSPSFQSLCTDAADC